MSDLLVTVCGACGWRGFPERLWCPACGSDDTATDAVAAGAVEQRTTVHRMPGRELDEPVALATVRLDGGGRAVARADGVVEGGDAALSVEDGAPVARARSAP